MRFQVLYSLTSFPCLLKKDIKKGRKAIYIGIYTKEIAITFDLSIYLYLFSDILLIDLKEVDGGCRVNTSSQTLKKGVEVKNITYKETFFDLMIKA